MPKLFRKRFIPEETIELEDDIILYIDEKIIITRWKAIRPKPRLSHGFSCYLLEEGIKISKFKNAEDKLYKWYCDIIESTYNESDDSFLFTDLLADVIITPEGNLQVLDLDELAEATEKDLITKGQLLNALKNTQKLLNWIEAGKFEKYQEMIDNYDKKMCP